MMRGVLTLTSDPTKEILTMPKDTTKRLKPSVLVADRESLTALANIPNYAPANPAFTMAALNTLQTELLAAQATETQAAAAAAVARDNANAKEWAFHEAIIGMRDQVVAQFGRDSDQAQTIGRKKESERKAPTRSTKTPTT
jgi:hypothetical protein